MDAIKYRPKYVELPTLQEKTWDYLREWRLIPVYEYALEKKDLALRYERGDLAALEFDNCLSDAASKEAFGLYNAILVHMGDNKATDEWRDFYSNCKWTFR